MPDESRDGVWQRMLGDRRTRLAALALGVLVALAVLGPIARRTSATQLDLANAGAAPSLAHPFGTDESGRDVLSRVMEGGRVSLSVGVAAVLVSLIAGVMLGALAGYRRGWLDTTIMRLTDAMLSIPSIFIVITALTFFGSSVSSLVIAIGATSWMGLARLVRGELLSLREQPYIEAARALGARGLGLFGRHLLPHLLPSVIVNATLGVGTAILTESALSFLGLGVQPPAASWGNMLSGAQSALYALPWLAVYPGMMILATVVAVNVLGDALRDATEPRETAGR
jgi:peptide/nickel transport system permease protein